MHRGFLILTGWIIFNDGPRTYFAACVESFLELDVPVRASLIRVLFLELTYF